MRAEIGLRVYLRINNLSVVFFNWSVILRFCEFYWIMSVMMIQIR